MERKYKARPIYCSKCKKVKPESSHRYCCACKATHQREWRKNHPMTTEQRMKNTVRRKTSIYVQRGYIKKFPCVKCDSLKAEAHHPDYSDFKNVVWMCRKCHLAHHKEQEQ
jgi:hypothetical protein